MAQKGWHYKYFISYLTRVVMSFSSHLTVNLTPHSRNAGCPTAAAGGRAGDPAGRP